MDVNSRCRTGIGIATVHCRYPCGLRVSIKRQGQGCCLGCRPPLMSYRLQACLIPCSLMTKHSDLWYRRGRQQGDGPKYQADTSCRRVKLLIWQVQILASTRRRLSGCLMESRGPTERLKSLVVSPNFRGGCLRMRVIMYNHPRPLPI